MHTNSLSQSVRSLAQLCLSLTCLMASKYDSLVKVAGNRGLWAAKYSLTSAFLHMALSMQRATSATVATFSSQRRDVQKAVGGVEVGCCPRGGLLADMYPTLALKRASSATQ